MSGISRLVVLVTVVAWLLGVMSSNAGAVTWQNDGDTSFTATGGQGTLSSTGLGFTCSGADVSGTAPATSTGVVYSISGTLGFTSCTLGGSPATIECGYTLTMTNLVAPMVTGNLDLTCGFYMSDFKLCHIEGTLHAQYTNPTGTVAGSLTTTTGSWRFTGVSCLFGSNDLGHVPDLRFNVTGPVRGPFITRIP